MDYNIMAQSALHNIELRHTLTEEAGYTKMLDMDDLKKYTLFMELAQREGQKVELTMDEASYRNMEKKIQDLFKGTIFGR